MSVTKLVDDIQRLRRTMRNTRRKRRNETKDQYIKRKNGYKCVYCHRRQDGNQLNVSIEPFHLVKRGETIGDITSHYRTTKKELENLNPDIDLDKLSAGSYINIPSFFKVFPNTHGICFCKNCSQERISFGYNHIEYMEHLLKARREIRQEITPELREKVFARDSYECEYCEVEHGEQKEVPKLTIDHKTPIVKGGTNELDNLLTSCYEHNQDKGDQFYNDYLERIKERKRQRKFLKV